MPGIHVRKASWIDWSQKGEDSALTVPGSYWLCHKGSIYKFIFRYHRTTRNIKKFNYGKELMKIIRQVIKSQPRQGQQFGTSHLLVTFNRTAWTRRDKIFAMIQFKERSVRAFSHAFILTIKMSYLLEATQSTKYATVDPCSVQSVHGDRNLNALNDYENKHEERSKKCLIHSTKGNFSAGTGQCDNDQKRPSELQDTNIELDDNTVDSKLKKLLMNKESVGQVNNSKSRNKCIKSSNVSFKLPTTIQNTKLCNETTSTNDNCFEVRSVTQSKILPEKFDTRTTELSNDEEKLDDCSTEKNSVESKDMYTSSSSQILNDYNAVDDMNIDSVNLPYQYLIEKEIENAKQNIEKRALEKVSRSDSTSETETNAKKKKYTLHNGARSSDITDLVMEGLMFTIRQGQDTVAVIEQKTKLEVDEVLENSEEIETKEGEKYLRNSSLLGLENLITMIELPNEKHEDKSQNVMVKDRSLGEQYTNKPVLNDIKYSLKDAEWTPFRSSPTLSRSGFLTDDSNTGTTNKNDHPKCEKRMKFSEIKGLQYDRKKGKREGEKEEAEEEEEDIVPEALQDEIFQSSSLSLKVVENEKVLRNVQNKDLLMDDTENEEFLKVKKGKNVFNSHFTQPVQPRSYSKYGTRDGLRAEGNEVSTNFITNDAYSNTICPTTVNETEHMKNKCKPNSPVVISNQVITLNQIPLPLQKILKNKLSVKHISSHKGKRNENNTNVYDTESCQKQDKDINVQLRNYIDDKMSMTDQCLKLRKSFVTDNDETCNETVSLIASNVKIGSINDSEGNIKLKEEKLQEQNSCSDKLEELSMSRVEDITEQFYQDLSYLEGRRNTMYQKYLRSRRKALNLTNDGNNDEMHLQMVKLFQDITRGAKVVVKRISINKCS